MFLRTFSMFLCGFQNNLICSLFALSRAPSWVILVQELLTGSLGCHSTALGSEVCRETRVLLLCETKNNSAMVREHLGLCPLRSSLLRTCDHVPAPTIPKTGQLEALGVPDWSFLGCCLQGCCEQSQLSSWDCSDCAAPENCCAAFI